jgi:hypothetical protein
MANRRATVFMPEHFRPLVYGLRDPQVQQFRYVGKTFALTERTKEHLRGIVGDGPSDKREWVQSLLDRGMRPEIVVLEVPSSVDDVSTCERNWIAKLRGEGHLLFNREYGEKINSKESEWDTLLAILEESRCLLSLATSCYGPLLGARLIDKLVRVGGVIDLGRTDLIESKTFATAEI